MVGPAECNVCTCQCALQCQHRDVRHCSQSGPQHLPLQRTCRPASSTDCMVLAARMARAIALTSSGDSGPRFRNSTSDWPCPVFGMCTCSKMPQGMWCRHAGDGHRLLSSRKFWSAAARADMQTSGNSAAAGHLHGQRLGSVAARQGIRFEAEHTGCAALGNLHGRRPCIR